MTKSSSRWLVRLAIVVGVAAVVAIAAVIAVPLYARSRIEKALGPNAQVDSFELRTAQLVLSGVRIGKPNDKWPTDAQLRIESAVVDLALSDLWSSPRSIPKLTIDGLYVAIVRSKDGSTHVLPDLTEAEEEPAPSDSSDRSGTASQLRIEEIELRDATVELVDDSMKRRARMKLTKLHGEITALDLPGLNERSTVKLSGVLPGQHKTGTVNVDGWMTFQSQDSKLTLRTRDIDLTVFEPYLLKSAHSAVEAGTFDFRITPTVRSRKVAAPGHIELQGLKLKQEDASADSFLSMPRAAVVKALEGRDGIISADFALNGNLDDPKFSLESSLSGQIGLAVAAALGVSIIGVAQGVGELGVQGVKAVGDAVGKDKN